VIFCPIASYISRPTHLPYIGYTYLATYLFQHVTTYTSHHTITSQYHCTDIKGSTILAATLSSQ